MFFHLVAFGFVSLHLPLLFCFLPRELSLEIAAQLREFVLVCKPLLEERRVKFTTVQEHNVKTHTPLQRRSYLRFCGVHCVTKLDAWMHDQRAEVGSPVPLDMRSQTLVAGRLLKAEGQYVPLAAVGHQREETSLWNNCRRLVGFVSCRSCALRHRRLRRRTVGWRGARVCQLHELEGNDAKRPTRVCKAHKACSPMPSDQLLPRIRFLAPGLRAPSPVPYSPASISNGKVVSMELHCGCTADSRSGLTPQNEYASSSSASSRAIPKSPIFANLRLWVRNTEARRYRVFQ